MSHLFEMNLKTIKDDNLRNARQIGSWVQKLSSYLSHSVEFREQPESFRKEFYIELVAALIEEDLPDAIWGLDAIRFVRRHCNFFPSLKTLCDLLQEFSTPIREADCKKAAAFEAKRNVSYAGKTLSPMEMLWLRLYHENKNDDFKNLAKKRATNPHEARQSFLSLLHQMAPSIYASLSEGERLQS
ncbi:hypothetical protein [Aristophania vespae]|uniref:hypothetical protein n=1 Tax=Aristophania vespae TaxID=2697033 RepID=UPI002351331C|nr:hypothetical protein [Aristophania vespae]UMM63165.1 hypothetical protein DM15PD_01200 [Aristophania vespae]